MAAEATTPGIESETSTARPRFRASTLDWFQSGEDLSDADTDEYLDDHTRGRVFAVHGGTALALFSACFVAMWLLS